MNKIRIIGGKWRGQKLAVAPTQQGLRPTPNRLRETLFNWLQPKLAGSHCLDLFAGTGALGLEAASRGAAAVTLVECNNAVFQQLKSSKKKLDNADIKIYKSDANKWLERSQFQFDIIFLDPPFNFGLIKKTCNQLLKYNALKQDGWVYMEAEPELDIPELWTVIKRSVAGAVQCNLIQYTA